MQNIIYGLSRCNIGSRLCILMFFFCGREIDREIELHCNKVSNGNLVVQFRSFWQFVSAIRFGKFLGSRIGNSGLLITNLKNGNGSLKLKKKVVIYVV
jgi:hypothetical protein